MNVQQVNKMLTLVLERKNNFYRLCRNGCILEVCCNKDVVTHYNIYIVRY